MRAVHRSTALRGPTLTGLPPVPRSQSPRGRRGAMATTLAVALVWFGLTIPSAISQATASTFVRVPLEVVVLAVLFVVLPVRASRTRTTVAVAAGGMLALLSILRLLDMGFMEALGRPFNPVVDWGNVVSGASLALDSLGPLAGMGVIAMAALIVLALLVAMPLAVVRIARTVSGHRRGALWATAILAAAWVGLAIGHVQIGGALVASTDAAQYAYRQVSEIPQGLRDKREFADAASQDPLRVTPTNQLLTGLHDKDVLFVFVESYGRVALEDPQLSGGIIALLDAEGTQLGADGYSSRSAFLTSPTFGGTSWFAHSTMQSGLWVDSNQRYDVLMESDRLTLSHAFHRAGWRTVADVPANTADWSRRSFYDWDKVYDSRNVGYAGPRFGYPTIPDQYTLDALHRLELAHGDRQPVMAEIDLVSSHGPWAPLPQLVEQGSVGDGSVFHDMPQLPITSGPEATRAAYAQSIEYSLGSLFSFMKSYGTDDTVLVFMGDHQPATVVSGLDSGNDVPVTIITKDPALFDDIADWGWDDGVTPGPDAPVWRMDVFRDNFLDAFGS